jgi:hypothetical protein
VTYEEKMTENQRDLKARQDAENLLAGWREAAGAGKNPGDESEEGTGRGILCIDTRRVYDVQVAFGGPTAYLRITTTDDGDVLGAEYITSEPDYANRRGGVSRVLLGIDEAEEVAELLGVTL